MNLLAAAAEILLGHQPPKFQCGICGGVYTGNEHGCDPEQRVTDAVQAGRFRFLMPARSGRARAKGYGVQ
jgi:hypothetical protein